MNKRVVPAAAWTCGLVAWLNATSWAFITPLFQVTDEPSHFAYVKQIAETGTLPSPHGRFSEEEEIVLEALGYEQVRQNPETPAIFSQAGQRNLTEFLQAAARAPGRGSPGAAVATAEPPLYYALESIPYDLGPSGNLLDRLQLMRLLSALFAGLTAIFTFLFLQEALPGVRWALDGRCAQRRAFAAARVHIRSRDTRLHAASRSPPHSSTASRVRSNAGSRPSRRPHSES